MNSTLNHTLLNEVMISRHCRLDAWAYLTGVILTSLAWPKQYTTVEKSLQNARASQLGSDVNETGIWFWAGAKFSTSEDEIFGPWTLCITVGVKPEDFLLICSSLAWSLPSISSSKSITSLSESGLFAILSVSSFHSVGSDFSVKSTHESWNTTSL